MRNSSAPNQDPSSVATAEKRKRFPIEAEEEERIAGETASKGSDESTSVRAIEEKEQAHKHKIEDDKIKIAIGLLIGCFVVVIAFSVGDAIFEIDSVLFSGAFEFAKTIATAIVGYLFAAGSKEK